MDTYKLRILPIAQQDMRDIVAYVNTLSPASALELYDDIIDGISSLSTIPMRQVLLKTLELRAKGYRALRVKNYTVFYVVLSDTVQIRRILYTKGQFESLL